jgi:hypothetical protein
MISGDPRRSVGSERSLVIRSRSCLGRLRHQGRGHAHGWRSLLDTLYGASLAALWFGMVMGLVEAQRLRRVKRTGPRNDGGTR